MRATRERDFDAIGASLQHLGEVDGSRLGPAEALGQASGALNDVIGVALGDDLVANLADWHGPADHRVELGGCRRGPDLKRDIAFDAGLHCWVHGLSLGVGLRLFVSTLAAGYLPLGAGESAGGRVEYKCAPSGLPGIFSFQVLR